MRTRSFRVLWYFLGVIVLALPTVTGLAAYVTALSFRAEFFDEVPLERRLSDLAQLNAALGSPVTVGDRLAFYRIYAGRETEWQRGWKEKVREIMKRTKARHHRWPA